MKGRIVRSLRKLVSSATTSIAGKYISKDRWYHYNGLRLRVLKDVFHPGLFRSTKVFAEWISQQPIAGKKVLEIGSGSGLLSLIAAKHGAIVTAIDINPKAVENTQMNAGINHLTILSLQSDLFDNIQDELFDLVLINPPYYPKQPKNDYEKAWYCGEDFNYFKKLFVQLSDKGYHNNCIMILSDTCDLLSIFKIAGKYGIALKESHVKIIAGEQLIIYRTASIDPA